MPKTPERSAIVGWGSVTPIGANPCSTWEAALSGRSGIELLKDPWSSDLATRIAGRVDETVFASLKPILRRRADRCAQLALLAARQAWDMALERAPGLDPDRVAVVIGTGIGGLSTMHQQHVQLSEGGASRVNPLTVPMLIPDAPAGQV